MKTQLLEDIGQSATLSLVPSGRGTKPIADEDAPEVAAPASPRSASGVWRQKPAEEVQDVPPAAPPVEPVLAADAPQDPVFDFTSPSPVMPPPTLDTHEPSWFERSGQRYLIGGLYVLASALVIQAGVWFYQERKDASSLALVADETQVEPQVEKAVKPRAIAAKEFTLGADGEVRVTPSAAPSSLPRPASSVPPLVLLEPEQRADAKPEEAPQEPPKPAPAKAKRAPDYQLARAPSTPAEKKPGQDATMSASLKACKEHGYNASQCVKRACSVTKYGFVCRG